MQTLVYILCSTSLRTVAIILNELILYIVALINITNLKIKLYSSLSKKTIRLEEAEFR